MRRVEARAGRLLSQHLSCGGQPPCAWLASAATARLFGLIWVAVGLVAYALIIGT